MMEEKRERGTTATTWYLCISSPMCIPTIFISKSLNTGIIKYPFVYLSNTVYIPGFFTFFVIENQSTEP